VRRLCPGVPRELSIQWLELAEFRFAEAQEMREIATDLYHAYLRLHEAYLERVDLIDFAIEEIRKDAA
jgi:hypothetical protein